jgi:hypothetical protein
MISMSHLRLVVLSSLALCLGLAGCESKACTDIGCREGLLITFDDSFESSKTYDVVVSDVTTAESVRILGCTLLPPADSSLAATLECTSPSPHSESGRTVSLREAQPMHLDIEVSMGGAQIADKQFDVAFKTVELNGPGCGTCTSASVTMSLP